MYYNLYVLIYYQINDKSIFLFQWTGQDVRECITTQKYKYNWSVIATASRNTL